MGAWRWAMGVATTPVALRCLASWRSVSRFHTNASFFRRSPVHRRIAHRPSPIAHRPPAIALPSSRRASVLMVQGTSSHAGKSTLVAALCRLFARAGYRVAPFKAQNMSNNAAVTDDGGEVGRAQAMQAAAAGVAVTVDMNPILLKPQSDRTSQVVVLGRARDRRDAREYYDRTAELWPIVTGALDRLRDAYDIVVIEGAGSPAEINLERYDIVNMRVARQADAPVLLVGDIERGGVFASLYGTVALLPESDRRRIRGFIINKFRGDPSLLDPGFATLLEMTGVPTLGVLPYLDLSRLPAEDAVDWDAGSRKSDEETVIDVAVMRLPRIANLDEFQPLGAEAGVRVRWIADPGELGRPDLIVIPGSKSTMADLDWLRQRGLDVALRERRARGTPVFGICGGFQMLGSRLVDGIGAEDAGVVDGLGLLPVTTHFSREKITRRVQARWNAGTELWSSPGIDAPLDAYEIHMGRTTLDSLDDETRSLFTVSAGGDVHEDGCATPDGLVAGTYLHGLFENGAFRRAVLLALARRKAVELPASAGIQSLDEAFDALADAVARDLDMDAVGRIVGRPLAAVR
jgi:adenosylcobyric acid synthase